MYLAIHLWFAIKIFRCCFFAIMFYMYIYYIIMTKKLGFWSRYLILWHGPLSSSSLDLIFQCALCWKEAFYFCCWNTSYCSYNCQQKHWPTHMPKCMQSAHQGQGQQLQSPPEASLQKQTPILTLVWFYKFMFWNESWTCIYIYFSNTSTVKSL